MKIRNGFVSNSSSSSFVIVYDKDKLFDLKQFLKNNYIGCESYIKNSDEMESFCKNYFDTDEERNDFKQKIIDREKQGKQVFYLSLDHEFEVIINMLKMICVNNPGAVEFLYDNSEC